MPSILLLLNIVAAGATNLRADPNRPDPEAIKSRISQLESELNELEGLWQSEAPAADAEKVVAKSSNSAIQEILSAAGYAAEPEAAEPQAAPLTGEEGARALRQPLDEPFQRFAVTGGMGGRRPTTPEPRDMKKDAPSEGGPLTLKLVVNVDGEQIAEAREASKMEPSDRMAVRPTDKMVSPMNKMAIEPPMPSNLMAIEEMPSNLMAIEQMPSNLMAVEEMPSNLMAIDSNGFMDSLDATLDAKKAVDRSMQDFPHLRIEAEATCGGSGADAHSPQCAEEERKKAIAEKQREALAKQEARYAEVELEGDAAVFYNTEEVEEVKKASKVQAFDPQWLEDNDLEAIPVTTAMPIEEAPTTTQMITTPAPEKETTTTAATPSEEVHEEQAADAAPSDVPSSSEALTFPMSIDALRTETLQEGSGTRTVERGTPIDLHVIGMLASDGSVFWSTGSPADSEIFSTTPGQGELIQGFDQGVIGMKEGEVRRIMIPFEMGYGAQGQPPVIPERADLIFEVMVRKIKL